MRVKEEIDMNKTVVTVVGKDSVGIIAKICTYMAENQINILDISQTIVSGYFNMMMITESDYAVKDVSTMAQELEKIGESIGVRVNIQNAEIFEKMHRI